MGVPTIFKLFFGTASQTNRIYHRTLSRIPFAIALVVWSVAAEMSIVPVMMIFDDGTLAEGIPVWIDKIQRVFRALIVISLLLLAERFTVNLVSINYKARRLEPRAYANRQHIHVLKKLYAKSIELYPPLATEASRKRFGAWDWTMETGIEADKPPCPTLLTDLRLAGEQVRGAVGKWASEAVGDTPKKIGGRPSSTVKKALEAEHTARALGKRLFYSFVYSDKEELTQVDLGHKFLSEDTAEVERMFRMIDADGNGDLTVDEMVQFCIAASDERKSLDKSATGIDEAVEILDRFLLLIVVISSVLILGMSYFLPLPLPPFFLGAPTDDLKSESEDNLIPNYQAPCSPNLSPCTSPWSVLRSSLSPSPSPAPCSKSCPPASSSSSSTLTTWATAWTSTRNASWWRKSPSSTPSSSASTRGNACKSPT